VGQPTVTKRSAFDGFSQWIAFDLPYEHQDSIVRSTRFVFVCKMCAPKHVRPSRHNKLANWRPQTALADYSPFKTERGTKASQTICAASPPISRLSSIFVTTELCSDRGIPGTRTNLESGLESQRRWYRNVVSGCREESGYSRHRERISVGLRIVCASNRR